MPNTKQFEAFDVNELIFGGSPKMLSMVEVSEEFFKSIKQVYEFLEEGKTVSIEVPIEECLYHLKRESKYVFKLTKSGGEPKLPSMLKPIETVNWLFAKAPFFGLVGYSNI